MTDTPAQAADKLRKVAAALGDLSVVDHAAADLILRESAPRTPRRSGALAGTVRVVAGQVVAGDTNVVYAAAVHWGSRVRHMRAQPWISDTAQRVLPAVGDQYTDDVRDIIVRQL